LFPSGFPIKILYASLILADNYGDY
jgi:hypothetical protein